MKLIVALDMCLQAVEQVVFYFDNFSTTEAGHMYMVTSWPALVKVLLALHVHQVQLIDQALTFQQLERAVHSDFVDAGIDAPRLVQYLGRIKMLFCGFYNAKNGPALVSKSKAMRDQCGLQVSGRFGLMKRHIQLFPRILVLTLCASFSISSAFLMTSSERTF